MTLQEQNMTADVEAQNVALLRRCYEWANRLMSGAGHPVTRHDVEQFFAPDASMVTNDTLKCQGVAAHVKHFEEIQKKTRSVLFHPFEIVVARGERVGVYFKIDVKYADGRDAKIFIAGFFLVRNQRIADFTEVAHSDGAELQLENH
jgi:hypothetical protein